MKTIASPKKIQQEMEKLRRAGKTIGFVPTMGALHEGHLALLRKAGRENDIVTASIFVNPLQFGPKEDFKKYPRVLGRDSKLLKEVKTDFLFYPSPEDMYPGDAATSVEVERLSQGLCGKFRPGHFRGVTTVVSKLFNIAKPHRVYFGAKDYQQATIIRRMILDLNFDIEFKLCPTVREKDGLAMSSRNRYLSAEERDRALAVSSALFEVRDRLQSGAKDLKALKKAALKKLSGSADKIDYFEIVDPETLEVLQKPQGKMVALAACFVGKTRLIDNVIITRR